jgi:CzcA family heavy metal efflux pump
MLTAIVRASLRYPLLVIGAAMLVAVLGIITLLRAKYDVFPEFVPAQADIQTEAAGMSPEDVELLVTQPLENAINGGANIEVVRSESIQGLSTIKVVFVAGGDVFRDRQMLAERVAEASSSLPTGVRAPTLGPLTSSTMDLLKVGFTSDSLSPMALRTLVDVAVKPRILAVTGVARAIVYGGERREIQIQVHPNRLAVFGLSLRDVMTAATAATGIRGAGFIDTPTQRVLLATAGAAQTPAQIGAVVVSQREGNNVLLRDVASVQYDAEPPFGDARVQGKPDVLISISSQYGANTLEVTRAVENRIAELTPMLKRQGVAIHSALHRPANFIEIALRNMRDSLALGALLVVLVLIGFLRNWRTALISFVTIPLSLLAAVMAVDGFGWTINTMTLGGLAVAVGIVVDDAIIDVENIVRRLRLAAVNGVVSGSEAIVLAASIEVRRPIVLATLVVGIVFVPILLLKGLQGSFFAPLAAAFLVATFASLLVALTVTPALTYLLLRRRLAGIEPRWVRRLKVAHHRRLASMLRFGRPFLIMSLVVGALALLLAQRFGGELMPPFREGHFVAQVTGPPGASLAEMTRLGERISMKMLAIEGIQTVSQQVGRAEAGEDTWSPSSCEFHIELKSALSAKVQMRVEQELREVLAAFPGLQTELVTFLGDRISESISGETAAVAVKIFGPDLNELDRIAAEVATVLQSVPDAADVQRDLSSGVPMVSIRPKLDRLAAFGIRPLDLIDDVALAFAGGRVSQVYEGSQPVAVRVVLDANSRHDPERVGQLLIKTPAGRFVPLASLADVNLTSGRGSITHEAGQRRQVVTLNPTTNDLIGFAANTKQVLNEKVKLPPDVVLEVTGEAAGAEAGMRDLLFQSTLAVFAVIMLLLFAFPDWRSVSLILVNVPFALVGGVIAVALTGASISIGALVGFVALFGISSRNTIMLIAHYEHLVQQEGMSWSRYAVLRGARERLTPILMTATVTALGLLPLAIGSGEAGREVEGPMAVVILGGLLSSTFLNLMIVPALAHRYLSPHNFAKQSRRL